MSNQFLKLRRSSVPGKVPTTSSLEFGEIALNTYDGLAFMKKSGSAGEEVVTIGSTSGSFTGSLFGTASWAVNVVNGNFPNILNTVTVGLSGSTGVDYNSIKTALDTITNANANNPYAVIVSPGVYIEDTMTVPQYVIVKGDSSTTTIVSASNPNNRIFNMSDQSMLIDMQVQGSTGTGVSAIYYSSSTTPQTFAIAYVENVRFGTNYTNATCEGLNGANIIMQCSNVKYGGYTSGSKSFDVGFVVTGSNSGIGRMQLRNVTSTNGGITGSANQVFALANGPGCTFIVNGCLLTKSTGAARGTGFLAYNGASLRLTSVNFQRWEKAIYMPNTGSAPSIFGSALNFENDTYDLIVEHPSASGHVDGLDTFLKSTIPVNAPLYEVNQDPKRITVAKKGGDFSSISASVAWITDSSANNRYVIEVGPGQFVEKEIDLRGRPYVSIVGSNIQTTEVFPSSSNQNIIRMGINNEISFLSLTGAGPGYAAIYVDDIGDFAQAHKVSIYDSDIGIFVNASTVDTNFYGEYIDINGTYTYGTYVSSSLGIFAFANMENYYQFPINSQIIGNYVVGPYSSFSVKAALFQNDGTINATAFRIEDGGQLEATSLDIQGFDPAYYIPNIGAGPTIRATGVMVHDSLAYDFYNENPSTIARYTGLIDGTKVVNNSSNVYWNRLDDITGQSYMNSIQSTSVTASFLGNLEGTASWARNALTASSADNLIIRGAITGSDALFTGTITAQRLNVQYITASTELVTGSTKFGTQLTDTHQFTGSVSITGSLTVTGPLNATSSWASNALTASYVNPLRQTVQVTGSLEVSGSALFYKSGSADNLVKIYSDLNVWSGIEMGWSTAPTAELKANESGGVTRLLIKRGNGTANFQILGPNDSFVTTEIARFSAKGIGVFNSSPSFSLDVSGSGRYTNGLQVTGSVNISGSLNEIGLVSIQGTSGSDGGQLGSELLSTANWTSGSAWTGDFNTGFTHLIGNTTPLTNTLAAVTNTYYQITYTVTGRTAGSFVIAFGGYTSAAITATGAVGPKAISTGTLSVTPTTDFDGTVVLSIKTISSDVGGLVSLKNSAGAVTNELRASNSFLNTFIGINAGRYNTTGLQNTFIGSLAGQLNTTGDFNTFIGRNSGNNNTIGRLNTFVGTLTGNINVSGSNNSFFGSSAGSNSTGDGNSFFGATSGVSTTIGASNSFFGSGTGQGNISGSLNSFFGAVAGYGSTGNGNSFFGYYAGFVNAGSNNTFIGTQAGMRISAGTNMLSSNNSVFLGTDTKANADGETNQIIIGYSAIGLGSNTTAIGNSSTTTTWLGGNLLLGSTTSSGDRIFVSGSGRITNGLQVTGSLIAPSITGSLFGTASWALNALTASSVSSTAIVGDLSRIATGSVTASVGVGTGSFQLVSGSSTFLYVSNSGNVGIGTTGSSAFNLEVSGSTRINSTLRVGVTSSVLQNTDYITVDVTQTANIIPGGTTPGGIRITGTYTDINNSNNTAYSPFISVVPTINFSSSSLSGTGGRSVLNISPVYSSFGSLVDMNTTTRVINASPTFFARNINNIIGISYTPTISGSNSIQNVIGIYYSASLNSFFAATNHKAIETVTGDVIFGSTSGNVGIRTTTPSASLHISGSTGVLLEVDSNALNNILYVTSSGQVGIGTSAPSRTLHLSGSNAVLRIQSSTAFAGIQNSTPQGNFYTALDSNSTPVFGTANASVLWSDVSSPMIFATSNSEKARISTLGNVLINTTTDAGFKLDVSGSARVSNQLYVQSASLDYQQNLSVQTGSWQNIVASPTASYKAAFFDYVAFSGSIGRAGTVTTFWSASATEFYENYTEDLGGSTAGVVLQTAISSSQIVLQATASSAAWTIRSLVRLL